MTQRKSFFKYVTAEVAKTIIAKRSLRWSSPLLFDDAYDVTRELAVGISTSKMMGHATAYLRTMVVENLDPGQSLNPSARILFNQFKFFHGQNRLDWLIADLQRNCINQERPSPALHDLKQIWQQWLPEFRILCLSAENDIPTMWDKYADKSKGVVLEFACLEEFSAPWIIAKPVRYENKPALLSEDGWGRLSILTQEDAVKYLFHESCHTKTTDWAYQIEWRVVSFKREHETERYSDYGFFPQTLSAIYFGSSTSDRDAQEIRSLLKGVFSHVRTFSGYLSADETIEFTTSDLATKA